MSFVPFLLVACAPLPPAPEVVSVAPDWGWRGETTDILVSGADFLPNVVLDEDGGRVDAGFRMELGTEPPTALQGVTLVDYEHLYAEVPAGLEPGRYDLKVIAPSGREALLERAFRVSETRADRLVWSTPTVGLEINDYAPLTLAVVDPDGAPVAEDLAVEVRVSSPSGAAGVTVLYDDAYFAPAPFGVPDGLAYRGRLHADGTADFQVTSSVPDEVTLTAVATEEELTSGEIQLSFGAGTLDRLDIVLPGEGFVATAGESFDVRLVMYDEHGVELGPQPYTILLYDDCGSWAEEVDLAEEGPVEVTLTRACPTDTLRALGVGVDEAVSAEFRVDPGAVDRYEARATPDSVRAGTDFVGVQATAVDAWGNAVADHAAVLSLYDDLGGLAPGLEGGYQSCSAFRDGLAACTARLLRAGDAVTIEVRDEAGLSGTADPIRVLAGDPVNLFVGLDVAETYADTTFPLAVTITDAWGNAVDWDPTGPDPATFTDTTGTLSCADPHADGEGWGFTCGITQATARTTITVEALGLSGEAPTSLEVDNGDLDHGTIEFVGDPYAAGEEFAVSVRMFDRYNNPYSDRGSDPEVTIADATGTLAVDGGSPVLVPREDGIAEVQVTITQAGPGNELRVEQDGTTWITSRAFTVEAADLAGLEVDWPRWVEVGVETAVEVVAVDAWGNPVRDYAGVVDVASASGLCTAVTLADFDEGRATAGVTCDTLGFEDQLEARDGDGWAGNSAAFDVVDLACAAGPVADLELEGGASATVCLVGGVSVVTADATGSVPGDVELAVIHYADSDGGHERLGVEPWDVEYSSAGTRRVEVLVVDADGCAAETSGLVHVGEDDGSATGLLTVTPSASSVAAGGTITVDLAATDCAGDVAAGATLRLRADLGEPAATATGTGLEVTLDAAGAATVDWDFPAGYAADVATLSVASATGSAQGSAEVAVTGDTVRPTVATMDPIGATTGLVDRIVVTFTEAMLETNFTTTGSTRTVVLTGPSTAPALTASLDDTATVLTITPATPIDADLGVWTLRLTLNVRDTYGNRLSGDWSGSAADFSGTFGPTGSALPTLSGCSRSASTFVPDGDDGAGVERDTWTLTPTTSGSPTWWWMSVEDADGERVRVVRVDGTRTEVEWDGRGDDGRVVEPGDYTGRLYAVDDWGNLGLACTQEVAVEQHVDLR